MKRILASVGLVALGASTLHAQYAPGLSPIERSKPWTVAASLRGFYDDNYLTLPGSAARDSFGLDFSPSVSINHSTENTLIGGSYVYDLKHYDDDSHNDQSHQFGVKFDHAFSERYKLRLDDSFVIGQEPEILAGQNNPISTAQRLNGSNLHNTGTGDFTAELTETLGLGLNYQNNYYSYENDLYSSLLDRVENLVSPTLRWKVLKNTTAILGYSFGDVDYTSSTLINGTADSSIRNNRLNRVFVGADQTFTPQLTGSVRLGADFTDYYNENESNTSPYADANLQYTYMKGSYAQIGIKQLHNASDTIGTTANNPILDESSTVPYLSISHKITPKLTAGAMVQYQASTLNGGSGDGQHQDFTTLNLNLAYQFTPYVSAETGYDYSILTSDVSNGYVRNVGYMGVRVTY